ncbi:MAG: undecaprenyl-diphosphatase UppP [Anaerolineaceae bacterium]|nr:undecaprenyl-diphosphatase UppP [Anaerolineaceae bacterium]
MSLLQSIILGIIQGLSEFLPISSSAHLVLIPFLLGWDLPEEQVFPFDVLVQLATLLAVIIYFRKDLLRLIIAFFEGLKNRKPFEAPDSRLAWFIILATIPAGLAGLLLDDVVEAAFNNPAATAIFLLVTALFMWLAESYSQQKRQLTGMRWLDALLIGAAQALAIFPGISRSGSTISAALGRQFDRSAAGRFSFLISIPIMLAAGLLSALDLVSMPNLADFLPVMVVGFLTAGVVGYLSIHWLLKFIKDHSLKLFSVYCVVFAGISLLVYYVR